MYLLNYPDDEAHRRRGVTQLNRGQSDLADRPETIRRETP
jgi:hypothetical protein